MTPRRSHPGAHDCAGTAPPDALRVSAAAGLAATMARLPDCCAGRLRTAAFEVVAPLLWSHHTRPLELRKGHGRCAAGLALMGPECADGFTDDLEAVVSSLLGYRAPITNVEGWVVRRMAHAVTDGHRARRSREMGALQRPRVPKWLSGELGGDPWLEELARRILQWTGVRTTAGTQLWPVASWLEARRQRHAAPDEPTALRREIDQVLTAMRRGNESWYRRYVEGPLGLKWAPVSVDPPDGPAPARAFVPGAADAEDAALTELATTALVLIREGLAAGRDGLALIPDVLDRVFEGPGTVARELDRTPGGPAGPEPGSARLRDTRLVAAVLAILDDDQERMRGAAHSRYA